MIESSSAATRSVVSAASKHGQRLLAKRDLRWERRAAAYRRFDEAVVGASVHLQSTSAMLPVYLAPLAFLWREAKVADLARGTQEVLAELMGALMEIRTVGRAEPLELAEQICIRIGELAESLPVPRVGVAETRARKFDRAATEIGELGRQYSASVRRDLGFERPLRRQWWQLWRRRTPEPFPGGWPVQKVEL